MEKKSVKKNIYNAKINDLYNQESGVYVTQGVKRDRQNKFEQSIRGQGQGSNGTYLMFDEKVTYTFLQLYVYDLEKIISIDIRQLLKKVYNGKKLTKKFLAKLQFNMPKKIKVEYTDNVWKIVDYNSLQLTL
jgi:transposase-like protein